MICLVWKIFYKDAARERNESLLLHCRAPQILCKDAARECNESLLLHCRTPQIFYKDSHYLNAVGRFVFKFKLYVTKIKPPHPFPMLLRQRSRHAGVPLPCPHHGRVPTPCSLSSCCLRCDACRIPRASVARPVRVCHDAPCARLGTQEFMKTQKPTSQPAFF